MILTTGEDGNVFVLDVVKPASRLSRSTWSDEESAQFFGDHDIYFVERNVFEQQKQTALMHDMEMKQMQKDHEGVLQIEQKKLSMEIENVIAQGKLKEKELQEHIDTIQKDLQTKNTQMDIWKKQQLAEEQVKLEELRDEMEEKLSNEYDRFEAKCAEGLVSERRWEERLEEVKREFREKIETEMSRLQEIIEKQQVQISKLLAEIETQEKQYEEALNEMEGEQDVEIIRLKKELEQAEQRILQNKAVASAEMRNYDDKLAKGKNRLSYVEIRVGELEGEVASLKSKNGFLMKELQFSRKKVKERERELSFRQHELTKARKDNHTLQNYHKTVETRIHELQEREDPTLDCIKKLSRKMKDMDGELVSLHTKSKEMEHSDSNKSVKLKSYSRMLAELRVKTESDAKKLSNLQDKIKEIVETVPSQKWNEELLQFYNRHVTDRPLYKVQNVRDEHSHVSIEDVVRQKSYLEGQIAAADTRQQVTIRRHVMMKDQTLRQNMSLLKEVNELRMKLKHMQIQNAQVRSELEILQTAVAKKPGTVDRARNTVKAMFKRVPTGMSRVSSTPSLQRSGSISTYTDSMKLSHQKSRSKAQRRREGVANKVESVLSTKRLPTRSDQTASDATLFDPLAPLSGSLKKTISSPVSSRRPSSAISGRINLSSPDVAAERMQNIQLSAISPSHMETSIDTASSVDSRFNFIL